MHELNHEADTLSSLMVEQEAVKAARKKFPRIELKANRCVDGRRN